MTLYRGRQTLAHTLIGAAIAALLAGFFGASVAMQLAAVGVYALGREAEDVLGGATLDDSFRDVLEVFAGGLAGALVGMLFGML